MSSNYPEGSMMGSGIYATEFEYGTFTCADTACLHDNFNAIAYADDWGRWTVECEECELVHDKGDGSLEKDEDQEYDEWKDSQI
jgi:hypothetical protein